MYDPRLLKRFMTPTHSGELPHPHGLGIEGNVTCGDVVHLALRFDGGRIVKATFATRGCAIAIAASDAVCELVQGTTLTAAQTLGVAEITALLGELPPDRQGCVEVVLGALRTALQQARRSLTAETA